MKANETRRITCGVIEHTPLGQSLIEKYIRRVPELDLRWMCDFQENAHPFFENHIPNLVFMNLRRVPVEVVSILRPILMYHRGIIITTGYLRAEVGEIPFPYVSYLMKPFSFDAFLASIERYKQTRDGEEDEELLS